MSLPFRPRQFIFPGVWLTTAVIAYSVGSMSAPQPKNAAATGGGGVSNASGAASGAGSGSALGAGIGSLFGKKSGAATTAEITGGMPMGEYLKQLLAQEDEATRMTGFLRLLETLNSPADIEEALKVISDNGERGRGPMRVSREYGLLLERYTKLDAKAAAAYASDPKRSNEERWIGTGTVLKTWTRLDPEAAIAWAEANGNPPTDGNNQRGPDGNWAVASVVGQLARTNIDRAMEVAASQDVSRSRGRMMDTLINELLAQREETGARDALLALPAGTFRDGILAQLAGRLADKDGPGTAQWVLALPPGDGRTKALTQVIGQWTRDDAAAVGKFMNNFPLGAESDPLRETYATSVVRTDPPGALAWAGTITTPETRDRTIQNIVNDWKRRDQTAALAWVAAASLDDNFKATLSAPGGGGGRRGGPGN